MCMTFNIGTNLGTSKPACQKLLWRHEYHRTKWSGQILAGKWLIVRQRSSTFKGEVQAHSTSHTVLGQASSICLTYLKNIGKRSIDSLPGPHGFGICNYLAAIYYELFVFHKSMIHLWDYVGVDFQTIFHSEPFCLFLIIFVSFDWFPFAQKHHTRPLWLWLTRPPRMPAGEAAKRWWLFLALLLFPNHPRRADRWKNNEKARMDKTWHSKTCVTQLNPTQVLFGQAKAFQKLGLKCQTKSMIHLGDLMRSSENYWDILSVVRVIQAFQGLEDVAGLKDISILVKTIQDLPQVVLESKYWGWVRQKTNTSQTKGLPITYWPKSVPLNGLKFDENSLRTAPPSSCWPPALGFALPMDSNCTEKNVPSTLPLNAWDRFWNDETCWTLKTCSRKISLESH